METAKNQCITVLSGSWNPAIFSPQWTRARVFPNDDLGLEIQFAPSPMWRFLARGVTFEVLPNRIQVIAETESDDALKLASEVVVNVLGSLPETPMQAAGINYVFEPSAENEFLARFLRSIKRPLAAEDRVSTSNVGLSLPLERGQINITLRTNDESLNRLEINYHWPGENARDLAAVIAKQDYRDLRKRAQALASKFLDMKGDI